MITTQAKVKNEFLTNQLAEALIKFSEKRLDSSKAYKIASVVLDKIDFSNPTLSHKGINWFAKDLLKRIRF